MSYRQRRDLHGSRQLAAALLRSESKSVSAMVRVRNEQEFLAASVHSIAPFVDEVVILDNASTDATPDVVRALVGELPSVRTFAYPFNVAKVGRENLDAVRGGHDASRRRLSSYYNWALRHCRFPFVLKWDADMVATDEFALAWESWQTGPYLSMSFRGANVHHDRAHLLASRSADPAVVGCGLAGNEVPSGALQMTHTDSEPRVFPRFLARYDDRLWWCERLSSPFTLSRLGMLEPAASLYLHLKYCKKFPHANHSADFASMIRRNMDVGPPLPAAWSRVLAEVAGDAPGTTPV